MAQFSAGIAAAWRSLSGHTEIPAWGPEPTAEIHFLQIYSVNFQISTHLISSLVEVINLGVLGPPGDPILGLGYTANLSCFSSCGNFNERHKQYCDLWFFCLNPTPIFTFSVSPPRQI